MAHGAGTRLSPLRQIHSDRLGWVMAVLVFAGYTVFSVWQWQNFAAPSWDLGIFTQLLDRYRTVSEPIVAIKGPSYHLWGDHFHPILLLLTPLFALFPSGLTLLIAQNALFAISIVPITWLARERMGRAGGLIAAAYALSWGLANAVAAQFHEIAFAVPLLAYGLVLYVSGRVWPAIALIGALVFVKEDLGLTVAAFAAVGLWNAWRRGTSTTPWFGLGTWGVAWFVLTVFVILPAFNTQGQWDYTDRVADAGLAGQLLSFVTPADKWITVALLIALGGVIALRSPIMIMIVPTLAWRFLGNVEYYWGWTWHYSAVLMPIVAVAAVDGYERWRTTRATSRARGSDSPDSREKTIALAVGVSALASSFLMAGSGPIRHVWHDYYVWDPDGSRAALADLEDSGAGHGAIVASDVTHLAYLAPNYETYWTGSMGEVIPHAWVVQLDEPLAEKIAYAQARWGGTWTAHVHGRVVLLTSGEFTDF